MVARPLALAVCLAHLATGAIYQYHDLALHNQKLLYRESGMYAPQDAPAARRGAGASFIKLTDLRFTRALDEACFPAVPAAKPPSEPACSRQDGAVQIAVLEHTRLSAIGASRNGTRYYCCDDAAAAAGACGGGSAAAAAAARGALIVEGEGAADVAVHTLKVPFDHGSELSDAEGGIFHVNKTGMYIVLFANCNPVNGRLLLNGHTEWVNPYGYLPGEYYHAMPFYFTLAIIYVVLAFLWYGLSCLTYRHLHAVHLWASAVLLLGMVETAAKYHDFSEWNLTGTRNSGAVTWGLVFGVTKRALSRVLVLLTAMGYGTVRPTLGEDLRRALMLAATYWVVCVVGEQLQATPARETDVAGQAIESDIAALLIMVSALVDAAFYAWTFHSLSWVLAHLKTKARPRPELTSLYRRFVGVLIVGGMFSFAWAIFGVVQTTGDRRDVHWELDWAVVAVWEVLYLYLLIAVCALLRPRMDGATSFGYSAVEMAERDTNQLMGDHDEELEYGGRQLSGDDEFAVAEETAFRKGKMAD